MLPSRPAAVGGFLLGGMAIVVAAILFFGGGEMFAVKTKAVVFFEGSVGGLVQGAPVTFRGVRVGSVESIGIEFDPISGVCRLADASRSVAPAALLAEDLPAENLS